MSVRSGILAVLSLGPAYGSQVHGEVETRMHRVGSINVGQIYSTLDRLQSQGFVINEGMTGDGLPLYALTARGRAEVETWLTTADAGSSWSDFVGHVLLVASLPGAPVDDLVRGYRDAFGEEAVPTADSTDEPLAALGEQATRVLSRSALAWLDDVQRVLSTSDHARPLGSMRPRRGRRPRQSS
ncbi:PadR family transcriptional regulator [Agreia sp. Leaf244]|uniref:PadR family transcriptional regulator n=1 Tax=Agreia sp. Leaf244 TaxID=1736305 RepID=UPI0006F86119|nr:PadR family transcriptional regulator [Agreia sp. Leaf244]